MIGYIPEEHEGSSIITRYPEDFREVIDARKRDRGFADMIDWLSTHQEYYLVTTTQFRVSETDIRTITQKDVEVVKI